MLPLSLLCDGSFRLEDADMHCSFAAYYGSPFCGLLIKHVDRAQIPDFGKRKKTSTEAEYAAVLTGLIWIRSKGLENGKPITVWSDCESVVNKINSLENKQVKARHFPGWFMKHESVIGH